MIVAIETPELDDKRDRRVGRGKRRVMEWTEREEETESGRGREKGGREGESEGEREREGRREGGRKGGR